MNLLKDVPGIVFGPDVVAWQKLIEDMGKSKELVLDPSTGEYLPMSCVTLSASEFGALLNPTDREMVDVLVSLWDGQPGAFKKSTKTSGNDVIENPWVNIIACTTPAWIAGNFPEYMIGGGFTSRCIFVYAAKKRQYVAYPADHVPPEFVALRADLIHDLEMISSLVGEYELDDESKAWGDNWYSNHWKSKHKNLPPEQFGGYLARKQTHIHKLAIVLAASESSHLVIYPPHLMTATEKVDASENEMRKLDLEGTKAQDRGFKAFKLAESNLKSWNAEAPHEVGSLEKQLDLHVNHIRDGRTADDLLYELLLKSGYPLTAPVEVLQLAGNQAHSVAGGVFFVCLERELTLELIRAMAEKKPERVVCL